MMQELSQNLILYLRVFKNQLKLILSTQLLL